MPAQTLFFPEYLRSTQSSFVGVDPTLGFNSSSSARFTSSLSSQMLGVPTNTSTFWTRVYLRTDADVSQSPGQSFYLSATDGTGDANVGEHVRLGEHFCQLELNRKSNDQEVLSNGGTFACTGGVILPRDTWTCLEVFFDGPGREVRVLVGGSEVSELHVTDWGPYVYGMFQFGFQSYGTDPARSIWYDDVAVAPQRIGCR